MKRQTHTEPTVIFKFYGGKMNKLAKILIISAILFVFGFVVTAQSNTPTVLAQSTVINVCSHNGTQTYNILGNNAASLRTKLDNNANFGPNGAYGDYDFKYIDVGDNFTKQTILDNECNIWFSGYEADADYTANELSELQSWVQEANGQVVAGCDDTNHDPVCALLDFSVTTDTDTYGLLTDTGATNPLNCNGALGPNSRLEMAGGAGGYFSGPGVTANNVLAVHETNDAADSNKPIVIYTGNFFLTADINMIESGQTKQTLSDGPDVTTANDILAMNAFSALADASIGKTICTSVEPAPPPAPAKPTCDCTTQTGNDAAAPAPGEFAGFAPISIYSLDNGSIEDSISDPALVTAAGIIHGDPTPTEDRFGNPNGALLFDGVDDYIETNEGSNFKPLTFSVWFRADDVSGEHSIVDSDVGGKYGHSLIIGYDDPNKTDDTPKDGSLDVQYHNGFWDTGKKIEAGVWYHAFVTFGDEMRLYLGAQGQPMELVAQQPYTGTEFDGSNFRFGRHNSGDPQWFKGAMDDIRFYNKALSLDEIKEVTECTCPPTESPVPNENVDNNSRGDVHINTPDRLVYDFQERGDFLLTQSTSSGDVVLQARQSRWETYPERPVSVNTAVAMNVAGDKLEFYLFPELSFELNDVVTPLPTGYVQLPQGGSITLTGNGPKDFTIYWPDRNTGARVVLYDAYIDIGIARLGGSLIYEGILGNMDGDPQNDIQLRGGDLITPPASDEDLARFGDSWRLSPEESLFNGALAGDDTAEGSEPLTLDGLDPTDKANAEDICTTAGVTDPLALHNCTYDVAATGDDGFVESAKTFQEETKDEPDKGFVAGVPEQGLPVEAPPAPSREGCYWQSNVSGEWEFQEGLTFEQCYEQDSCSGGLGQSGGGCYKWADGPDAEPSPWDNAEAASDTSAPSDGEPAEQPDAGDAEQPDAGDAEQPDAGDGGGPLSGICASATILPLALGMVGGWGAWNGRRRKKKNG